MLEFRVAWTSNFETRESKNRSYRKKVRANGILALPKKDQLESDDRSIDGIEGKEVARARDESMKTQLTKFTIIRQLWHGRTMLLQELS